MNRIQKATWVSLLAACSLGAALPAMASDKCQAGPQAQWQSKEALEKKLVAQGVQVKRIKIDDGCYEAYGVDAKGQKLEQYFHPKTLELVKG